MALGAAILQVAGFSGAACGLGRILANGQPVESPREARIGEMRFNVAAERKAMKQFEQLLAGRLSKRDRRRIIQFRGRG